MLSDLRHNHAEILDTIRNERDLSDATKGKLKAALDAFAKTFA
jgi:F-type H+-transporting ATPase subunit alpha